MGRSAFWGAVGLAMVMASAAGAAQTFDVSGQPSSPANAPAKKHKQNQKQNVPRAEGGTSMGWGSGIEVAREARATQMALDHGDPRGATEHAQRAVNAAPQNYELWFTLAYAARLSGQYSLSVDAYQRGLALKPNSVQGLSGLAQTYARMGRNEDAQKTLDQVLAADPKSDQDLQLAGELLLTTDPKKALGYLQRSQTIKSTPRTELLLARAYDRTGDKDAARNELERARRNAPRNPEIARAVASYYRDTGEYEKAIQILEGFQAKDATTLAELAYTYTLAGNMKAAAKSYGEAAKRAPKDIEIQLNAAQAMINAGEFGQATALLQHSEGLNPEHYRLFALRGRLDAVQHRDQSAIQQYEAALKHLPTDVPEGVLYPIGLRVDLAEIYRDAGDNANAERVTEEAEKEVNGLDVGGASRPEFLRLRAAIEAAGEKFDAAEKDLKDALQIEPHNVVLLLNYANLLRRTDRNEEALKIYQEALAIAPSNAAALGALGYLSRQMGNFEAARGYFLEYGKKYPDDYVPYLALGDLYSENRRYNEAQESYEEAFKRSPEHPLIVSGAMNAALEAHQFPEAKHWLDRAPEGVRQNPQVMREDERYLTMTGNYAESADLGYKVLEQLPNDREGVDYLAYDLLFLKRYDEATKLVDRYQPAMPQDRDLPLVAGHVYAERGDDADAVRQFTRALEIDPKMAVGYMNRGYVYNDMRLATRAEQDFRKALQLEPNYGEAHLGLAFALVQLRRATPALKEAEAASRLMPDTDSIHLVKAEAYRQRAMLTPAENEYKKALKLTPNSATTYIALGDVEYRAHRYASSAATLESAQAAVPNNPMIEALLGRAYARLGRTSDSLQQITLAERTGGKDYKVLLVTADALRVMKRNDQAMTTYSRALESSDENRLQVRLALGRLFADEGKSADAEQQVALAFAEARVAPTDVTTADDYLNAADILMGIHEYPLAERMYGRAQALGADETSVAVGMANAELALGETRNAQLQLASVPADADVKNNYEYQVSQGNVYRQLGKNDQALANFAQATQLDPENPASRTAELELAQQEGHPLGDHLGMYSGVRVNPVFEDDNIYQLDARLLNLKSNSPLLPLPRRTVETFADSQFQVRLKSFPAIQGFVAERDARGTLSFPSQLLIQNRNTLDTIFNVSVSPIVQIGDVKLNIMPGLQYTIRRDTLSPQFLNQNLFRQFVYVASSPIFDWFSFSGNLSLERGPFTEAALHSRDFAGMVDFRVGRPWSKTAFLTGYSGRSLLFSPTASSNPRFITEYYETISYAALERKFGSNIRLTAAAEFLRSWRIANLFYAEAQTLRPRFGIEAKFLDHWSLSADGAWSSGRNFHAYDSITTNLMVTYVREHGWSWKKNSLETASAYPVRFSFGFGQQSFYNFEGHDRTQIIPVAQVNF